VHGEYSTATYNRLGRLDRVRQFHDGLKRDSAYYLWNWRRARWFDSSTWGWSLIAGGILLLMAASLLLAGNMFGRIVGTILALASLFANVALFAAAPVWSTLAIMVDLVIIYAVIAHGSEMKQLQE
jgi:small-conductance mechanosensitive channel